MTSASSQLFEPLQVGDVTLGTRVVMAPLTATETHAPGPHAAEYYSQRSVAPGTLLITEATFIGEKAGGYFGVPGIYSAEHIEGWKKASRAADPSELARENPANDLIAASDIALTGRQTPRAMTLSEIQEFVQLYATAASNAVLKAGFDGVEIHSASGYLPDQFLQEMSNNRTDDYGGSVENRSRFVLEVIKAIVGAVGETKTALRLSPWSKFQDLSPLSPQPDAF
ncbi:hypothetical protein HWV62_35642 [Athelia sp. TMB]|nr:hypothetical protein HWV62_35642 [Athelia sp. TMB]